MVWLWMMAAVVQCTNVKPRENKSKWRCEADLPRHLKFDETTIICEVCDCSLFAKRSVFFLEFGVHGESRILLNTLKGKGVFRDLSIRRIRRF